MIVAAPCSCAAVKPRTTFSDRPDVVKPMATSPAFASACTCRSKSAPYPKSFAMQVTTPDRPLINGRNRPAVQAESSDEFPGKMGGLGGTARRFQMRWPSFPSGEPPPGCLRTS